MKLRIRQLENGEWLVESKKWYEIGWFGTRVDRAFTTKGAAASGVFSIPRIERAAPGSIHYPLCWHKTEALADQEAHEVSALLGA